MLPRENETTDAPFSNDATGARFVATALVAVLVCALPTAGAARGATVIDASNYEQVRDLLPEPVFQWVKAGDWNVVLGEMQVEVRWDPEFEALSAANAGRFGVDPEGGLIERESGVRPPYVRGLPFPEIDPDDADAGLEIMWNTTAATLKIGRLHSPFGLHWVGRGGFERFVRGHVGAIAYDFQPEAVPDPERTESRDIFEALGPASAEGIASLTWRFTDNRPDAVWGYLPTLRRVRQLTAANRSDPAYGSDLVQDDALLWGGKNQSFLWKLIEAKEVLVGTASPDLVPLEPGRSWAGHQEWLSPRSFVGARFGWEVDGWSGAPWFPTNVVWVRRPVWVVEGRPKDPYYAYGRQLFYVDRSTFKIYYKIIYTRAGEYWKTALNDLGLGVAGDGRRYPVVAALVVVDDQAQHASYTKGNAPDYIVEYDSAWARPELFTVGGLLRLGK